MNYNFTESASSNENGGSSEIKSIFIVLLFLKIIKPNSVTLISKRYSQFKTLFSFAGNEFWKKQKVKDIAAVLPLLKAHKIISLLPDIDFYVQSSANFMIIHDLRVVILYST